jgi:hypothetical protein
MHVQDSAWHLAAGYGQAEVIQVMHDALVANKEVGITQSIACYAQRNTCTHLTPSTHSLNAPNTCSY